MAGRTASSSEDEEDNMRVGPTEESEEETNRILRKWEAEKAWKKAEALRRQKRQARTMETDHVEIDYFHIGTDGEQVPARSRGSRS